MLAHVFALISFSVIHSLNNLFMKRLIFRAFSFFTALTTQAQLSPAVTSWLQNNTIKGRHYVSGNSTAIADAALTANVQTVQYSASSVCVTTCFLFTTSS
jgi:hypothetical protein